MDRVNQKTTENKKTQAPLTLGIPAPQPGYHYDENNLGQIVENASPFINRTDFENRHNISPQTLSQFTIGQEDKGFVNANNSTALGGGQTAVGIAGGSTTKSGRPSVGGLGIGTANDPGIISFPDMRTWAKDKQSSSSKSGPGTGGSSSAATPPTRPTTRATGDFSGPTMTPHSPAVDRNVASMTPRERDLYTGKANTVDGSPLIDAGGNFSPKVINDSIAEGSMTKGEDGKLYFTDTGEEVTKESTQAWMQKSGWLSGTPATQPTTEASGDLLAQPAASTAPETTTSTKSDGSGGGGGSNNYYKKSYSGGGGSGRSSGGYGRSSGGSWSSGRSSGGRGGGFDFASMFGGGDFDPDTDGDGKISAKEARAAKKRRGRKGRMGKGGAMMPGGPPSDIRAYVLGQLGEGFGRPVGGWPEQMNAPTTSKKKKKN
jgi:hypothetical protein